MRPTDLLILAEGTAWVEIALLIFFSVFVLIVLWVVFSRSDYFRKSAQIPLHDEKVVEPRTPAADGDNEETPEPEKAPRESGSES